MLRVETTDGSNVNLLCMDLLPSAWGSRRLTSRAIFPPQLDNRGELTWQKVALYLSLLPD